jgi:asparagine synthase (glutamine-hydrolysing)
VKPSLNLQALRQYLSFDYVPRRCRFYEGVNKLPAAHKLALEDGCVNVSRYWQLDYQTVTPVPTEEEAAEHCRNYFPTPSVCVWFLMFRLACCCQEESTRQTVAALAVRSSSEAVKTFSISFAESSFDESGYARAVAKFLGTDHHEERLSANLAANLVSEIGAFMDEPFSDPSLVPTYCYRVSPASMSPLPWAETVATNFLPDTRCTWAIVGPRFTNMSLLRCVRS